MQKILLDTNMFIYLEDYGIIDQKVATLTKRLFDSDEYKIVIHPKTKEEVLKIADEEKRKIFLSKVSIYKEIKSPPKADEKFHSLIGCKNSHDKIDNELLFSIYRNCAQYLITNDKEVVKKACKIGLSKRVLSIDKAIELFKEEKSIDVKKPVFVEYKYLHELDISDPFFNSLKNDYMGFEKWFSKKQLDESMAYITLNDGKIKSFLMTKIEDENEQYNDFIKPFNPAKRLKISTMKVSDTGKRIGETFIKIIVEKALKEKVDEIYVTVFDKQKYLIEMLESYGFEKKTKKKTIKSDGTVELENVLVKDMKNKQEFYPFIKLENKKIFIIPIREEYHKILFQESEKKLQLTLDDFQGKNTASNSLKKAYLCDSHIKKIEKGDIVLFYSSGVKKAITSLGVVDAVFSKFDSFEEMFNLVNKRTAYNKEELRKKYKNNKLVILFRLYYSFEKYVSFDYLIDNKIVCGAIQSIMEIDGSKLLKILDECQMDKELYLI